MQGSMTKWVWLLSLSATMAAKLDMGLARSRPGVPTSTAQPKLQYHGGWGPCWGG